MALSPSARNLGALLDEENSPEADAIRKAFHRTVLWRYRSGKGKPDADGVALLERLSRQRVAANGWEDGRARQKAKPRPNPNHPANRKSA